ncbi:uncharacterized oxidoreductase TM_0325-like [Dermacentor silvarum]|uniref:uncharacterized oxidoreductase TM_0325-like n=1 Tax=Dermacentor silvarum TaxID=543639 RepID=UPI00210112B4|nr:uncharacterized oxidoreductase TM_0325-like [Dermacentor silvarum]
MPHLKGKVAIITGASSGIGESTAKHFASLGCWLSLTARNTANLERVAAACCAQGLPRDKVLVVPGDISVEKDVTDVVQKTAKHFGKIDIIVNNAGISVGGSIHSASVEDFNRSWKTNFLGPLCMIKSAVPYLRQTKGSVVNISTIGSLTAGTSILLLDPSALATLTLFLNSQAPPGEYYAFQLDVPFHHPELCGRRYVQADLVQIGLPYAVSKAALDHLTRCAALGYVDDDCLLSLGKDQMGVEGRVTDGPVLTLEEKKSAIHALGRVATPEELARCIAFLASDDAAFVTGITMPVDGGLLLLSSVSNSAPKVDTQKTA